MQPDWDRYAELVLPTFAHGAAAFGKLKNAEEGLILLKSQILQRIEKLQALVKPLGIEMDGSIKSLEQLNAFFVDNIVRQTGKPHMAYGWREFVLDAGVYLGEVILDRTGDFYSWDILGKRKHDFFYLDIGLGHAKLPEKVACPIDLFGGLRLFGQEILDNNLLDERYRYTQFCVNVAGAYMFAQNPLDDRIFSDDYSALRDTWLKL